jgi:proteic killer suppression protein
MIVSFSDKKTEELFKNRSNPKGLPENIIQRALEKLIILHAVNNINDQWRIVFEWKEGNAYNVKIEDYHQ